MRVILEFDPGNQRSTSIIRGTQVEPAVSRDSSHRDAAQQMLLPFPTGTAVTNDEMNALFLDTTMPPEEISNSLTYNHLLYNVDQTNKRLLTQHFQLFIQAIDSMQSEGNEISREQLQKVAISLQRLLIKLNSQNYALEDKLNQNEREAFETLFRQDVLNELRTRSANFARNDRVNASHVFGFLLKFLASIKANAISPVPTEAPF